MRRLVLRVHVGVGCARLESFRMPKCDAALKWAQVIKDATSDITNARGEPLRPLVFGSGCTGQGSDFNVLKERVAPVYQAGVDMFATRQRRSSTRLFVWVRISSPDKQCNRRWEIVSSRSCVNAHVQWSMMNGVIGFDFCCSCFCRFNLCPPCAHSGTALGTLHFGLGTAPWPVRQHPGLD